MDSSSETQTSPNPIGSGQSAPFEAKMIFVGPEGIRAGWRLLIYICIVAVIGVGLFVVLGQIPAFRNALTQANQGRMNTTALIFSEIPQAIAVLLAAVLMSLIEKRSWAAYGMPLKQAFGLRFWEGMLWGVAAISAMIGLIAAFHGYSFGAIALSRPEIINKGLLYLFGFFLVGIFEEYSFRGYTQFTLATGIGFWPAAGILSGAFGALHLGNTGEGLVGAASVVMIAMFFCLTLRRTGIFGSPSDCIAASIGARLFFSLFPTAATLPKDLFRTRRCRARAGSPAAASGRKAASSASSLSL